MTTSTESQQPLGPRLTSTQHLVLDVIVDHTQAFGASPSLEEISVLADLEHGTVEAALAVGALEAQGYLTYKGLGSDPGTALKLLGYTAPDLPGELTEDQLRILELIQRTLHNTARAPRASAIARTLDLPYSQVHSHMVHLVRRGYIHYPAGRISATRVLKPLDLDLGPIPDPLTGDGSTSESGSEKTSEADQVGADLNDETAIVLLTIQDHLKATGAVPPMSALGAELGMSSTSVQTRITTLKIKGYISYPLNRFGAVTVLKPILDEGESFEVVRPQAPVVKELPAGPALSDRQREGLQIIVSHIHAHGYCPAPAEIEAVSIRITAEEAHSITSFLTEKGYLRRISQRGDLVEVMLRPPTPAEVEAQREAERLRRMIERGLTDRQRAILTTIHDEITSSDRSPTYEEIGPKVGLTSIPGVQHQVKKLVELGYIENSGAKGRSSVMRITAPFTSTDGRELLPLAPTGSKAEPMKKVVFEAIREHFATTGTAPSATQIGAAVGISGPIASYYVNLLRKDGILDRPVRLGPLVILKDLDEETSPTS